MIETCTGRVYSHIVNQLLERRLRPGEAVSRRDIAKTLGVSVSPIGEALLQLEVEGILETKPRSGTRVRQPSADDARAALTVRIALESEAVRIICGSIVAQCADRLLPLARRVDKAGAAGAKLVTADIAFHRALVELAGCAPLLWHFDRVARQSLLLTTLVHDPISPRMSHVCLFEELCTAVPITAQYLLRVHLCHGKNYADPDGFASAPPSLMAEGPASGRLTKSMARLLSTRKECPL